MLSRYSKSFISKDNSDLFLLFFQITKTLTKKFPHELSESEVQ